MPRPTAYLIDDILAQLSTYGPYIYKQYKDSVYIHFDNLPNNMTHKLRVSNHPEREKYGYKWQLRLDGVPPKDERKRYSRYYDDVETLVEAFISYYSNVEEKKDSAITIRAKGNVWP